MEGLNVAAGITQHTESGRTIITVPRTTVREFLAHASEQKKSAQSTERGVAERGVVPLGRFCLILIEW